MVRLIDLLDETRTPVAHARVRWHVNRFDSLVERGRWANAYDLVARLTAQLSAEALSAAGWRHLLAALAACAVRADLADEGIALFEALVGRAWPGGIADAGDALRELAPAFSNLEGEAALRAGHRFARHLASRFPTSPLGALAAGDLGERLLLVTGGRASERVREAADHFRVSGKLCADAGLDATARHCTLREGVLLLRTGLDRERGRALLKSLTIERLSPPERLWYAAGLLHSAFWLDRVRSADAIDALAGGVDAARPGFASLERERIVRVAHELFHASPVALQPAEADRLRAIAHSLFTPEERERWLELVALRPELEPLRTRPLQGGGDAVALLGRLAVSGDASWRDAFQLYTRLYTAWRGDDDGGAPQAGLQPPIDAARYHIAGRIAEVLGATRSPELGLHLRRLAEALRAFDATHDPMPLKPVALLWPHLLNNDLLRVLGDGEADADADSGTDDNGTGDDGTDDNGADDNGADDNSAARGSMTALVEIATRWAAHAPAPGYGWWPLAAHLLRAGRPELAEPVARRALSDGRLSDALMSRGALSGSVGSEALRRFVVGQLTDRAVAHGAREPMRFWLRALRELHTPNAVEDVSPHGP